MYSLTANNCPWEDKYKFVIVKITNKTVIYKSMCMTQISYFRIKELLQSVECDNAVNFILYAKVPILYNLL